MPQFDTFLYFTFFVTFIIYITILYFAISLFVVPFFWNIYYFRYIKKESNSFLTYLYNKNNKLLISNIDLILNYIKLTFFKAGLFKNLKNIIVYTYIFKLLKLINKLKAK